MKAKMVNEGRQAGELSESAKRTENPLELNLSMELAMPAIEAFAKRIHSETRVRGTHFG
jgi:hypothetical protein